MGICKEKFPTWVGPPVVKVLGNTPNRMPGELLGRGKSTRARQKFLCSQAHPKRAWKVTELEWLTFKAQTDSVPIQSTDRLQISLGGSALAPGPAAAPPRRRRGLFFWGVRWQVPGNKGNLGPAPRAACVARVCAPGPVWESLAPVPGCLQPAGGGGNQPGTSSRRRPPTCSGGRPGDSRSARAPAAVAAAGEGALGSLERGGEGGEAAGGGGGEPGWAGGATSRLLWLSWYIRSRRLAALPTLPAPARSQRFSKHPASSETRRAPTEGTWAEQWWPGSGWGCCCWHCSYPRRSVFALPVLYTKRGDGPLREARLTPILHPRSWLGDPGEALVIRPYLKPQSREVWG
ncbi:uncharacterized protein LOC108314731 [Cebus imitator]|uniref:uncharacterized protein LOC108314731 n=1 Tax=Cebus imitator TaxID=2715852 RepID=UPI0018974A7F|nr:uncharacterized protein LOC108314731 [Cebus imitator]